MLNTLIQLIGKNRIVLLGFGMEGQSSFRFFNKYFQSNEICIADRNEEIKDLAILKDFKGTIASGDNYLEILLENDFIVKSPGIKLPEDKVISSLNLFSQTDLFFQNFRNQIIGITGTKGKSTSATLMHKILQDQGKKTILLGNIGKPAIDYWDEIDEETLIVYELSAHQLEFTKFSPKYALLLNLFPEHLDYFQKKENYFNAKLNIAKWQKADDFFFCSILEESATTNLHLPKTNNSTFALKADCLNNATTKECILHLNDLRYLRGIHQLSNCIPLLDLSLVLDLNLDKTLETIKNFSPLPHRLEFISKINQLSFFNDSISTIPEATIEALKALEKVQFLILGGLDRTLDYQKLYQFIANYPLQKVFFIGPAGKRMNQELGNNTHFEKIQREKLSDLEPILIDLISNNKQEAICLLSPAAASYDEFKNFEYRGQFFRAIVEKFF
ncbi:MAG: UDP-N-acetylmuramoyl-L-alanine--D-glutamate ligase [Bacteroidales bacterium]|nr:UDP-N-acetylmuramoyl-L-alanine--D-glutamate ligase [Bacteroidales bacterium]